MREGELLLGGQYSMLRSVQASIGGDRAEFGRKHVCRFCGTTDRAQFRKIAHAFPEALGNKWVFSRDECDNCNAVFSKYEDALVKAVAPILTLGGTRGKGNKIRQTGRSAGRNIINKRYTGERPFLSIVSDMERSRIHLPIDGNGKTFGLTLPVPDVPFVPRYAYKALTKMALSIMPEHELQHYRKLIEWLRDPSENLDFPILDVGISFASIGNSPPMVAAHLLRRVRDNAPIPYIVFVFFAGSACYQIDLMSDSLEEHMPPVELGLLNIETRIVIGGSNNSRDIVLDYGRPVHRNWASRSNVSSLIEALRFDLNMTTEQGGFLPIFRRT